MPQPARQKMSVMCELCCSFTTLPLKKTEIVH